MSEIKDSGERRKFESGAVRDIQEGKGRCDLLPLDVIGVFLGTDVLKSIACFVNHGGITNLYRALDLFISEREWDKYTAILEVAKHYEEGCKKYGERNWEKGIPLHCFIDSAVRHYLKWRRGDEDEPHDRAFIWNIAGALWTYSYRPECSDLPKEAAAKSFSECFRKLLE